MTDSRPEPPRIDADLVARMAHLARLRLEPDEVAGLERDMRAILQYVEQLREVDTEGVAPLIHAHEGPTPLRDDEPKPGLSPAAALANAPDAVLGRFTVPRVLR